METYFNPYSGANFFEFFPIFFTRFFQFIFGTLSWKEIASDEIQLLVLMGVAASSALVGTFLVLRKMTMLANSISHTILLGIVVVYMFMQSGLKSDFQIQLEPLLAASLVTGLLTAFLTEFLTKVTRLQEDASTGLVFTSLFALGIILVTLLTRSTHLGTEAVIGNVDALQLEDAKLVYLVLGINIFLFGLFYKEYKLTTFDPGHARVLGFSSLFFSYLLMVQVSATSISAFRAVGVLMVLAFITGPSLTARLVTYDLKKLLFLSVGMGIFASFIGVAISRHILSIYDVALSTGGLVVCTLLGIYIGVSLTKKIASIF